MNKTNKQMEIGSKVSLTTKLSNHYEGYLICLNDQKLTLSCVKTNQNKPPSDDHPLAHQPILYAVATFLMSEIINLRVMPERSAVSSDPAIIEVMMPSACQELHWQCPVCKLYMPRMMSTQDHLKTHPRGFAMQTLPTVPLRLDNSVKQFGDLTGKNRIPDKTTASTKSVNAKILNLDHNASLEESNITFEPLKTSTPTTSSANVDKLKSTNKIVSQNFKTNMMKANSSTKKTLAHVTGPAFLKPKFRETFHKIAFATRKKPKRLSSDDDSSENKTHAKELKMVHDWRYNNTNAVTNAASFGNVKQPQTEVNQGKSPQDKTGVKTELKAEQTRMCIKKEDLSEPLTKKPKIPLYNFDRNTRTRPAYLRKKSKLLDDFHLY